MIRRTVTEDLALAILTRSGIGTIWRLHTAAAEVYQIGNPTAAAAILELADAAERMSALGAARLCQYRVRSKRRGTPGHDPMDVCF
jgi:hypothetical protein